MKLKCNSVSTGVSNLWFALLGVVRVRENWQI